MKIAWILALACASTVLMAANAHAYLDPGSGSYVIQVLIAAVAGSLFAVKTFWRSIKSFAGRITGRKKPDDDRAG